MSIGSAVGMTSKSVKARVDTMLSTGVIEEFVVKVNPVALGYGMNCMLIVREHTEHTQDILNRLNRTRMDLNEIGRRTSMSAKTDNKIINHALKIINLSLQRKKYKEKM